VTATSRGANAFTVLICAAIGVVAGLGALLVYGAFVTPFGTVEGCENPIAFDALSFGALAVAAALFVYGVRVAWRRAELAGFIIAATFVFLAPAAPCTVAVAAGCMPHGS
jgi:hypothetical protein